MDVTPRQAALVTVLRLFALVDMVALLALILPRPWMATAHAALGMGDLPNAPVVGYLARSTSWLYALHGATILVMSFDVVRYARLITFLALAAIVHGVVMLTIDLSEGMPWWWVALEGPTVAATGTTVLLLQKRRPA